MKLKTFDQVPTGKEFTRAWGKAFEEAVRSVQQGGRVSRQAATKLAEETDASHLFADNILNLLDQKDSIEADALIQAGFRYVNHQVKEVIGDLEKRLTLWDVRKLNLDLVEDGYAIRGKEVPKKVAEQLGIGASDQALDLLTGETKAPEATPEVTPEAAAVDPAKIAEAQMKKDPSVTTIFTKPTSRSSTTVRFELDDYKGEEIKPGERWLFQVPEDLRGGKIRTVILAHRKAEKYASSYDDKGHDHQGAYNLVSAREVGTDKWLTWRDQHGSKKFAEKRGSGDPEHENLHDWLNAVGYKSIDLLSVTNVGKGEKAVANVHLVELEFFPPGETSAYQEEIFTPGTSFIDPENGIKMPKYGGGKHTRVPKDVLDKKGLYPDSVEIETWGGASRKVSKTAYVKNGDLHIKLPPGKKLGAFEISVGDTQWKKGVPASEQMYKGHVGRRGWAKLYASINNTKTGEHGEDFMVNVNVPPAGVLSGSTVEADYITKPGDEIVVRSEDHESWVMGYRVQFLETDDDEAKKS